jgi:hypothetical protein
MLDMLSGPVAFEFLSDFMMDIVFSAVLVDVQFYFSDIFYGFSVVFMCREKTCFGVMFHEYV